MKRVVAVKSDPETVSVIQRKNIKIEVKRQCEPRHSSNDATKQGHVCLTYENFRVIA